MFLADNDFGINCVIYHGKNKKDFLTIIATEKNIGEGTKAIVRPMWKKVFPSDEAKITVKITTK